MYSPSNYAECPTWHGSSLLPGAGDEIPVAQGYHTLEVADSSNHASVLKPQYDPMMCFSTADHNTLEGWPQCWVLRFQTCYMFTMSKTPLGSLHDD